MIGMVKAVLSIEHGFILPNHGFEKFSERIPQKEKLRVGKQEDEVTPTHEYQFLGRTFSNSMAEGNEEADLRVKLW